jgi:hypothetical protein
MAGCWSTTTARASWISRPPPQISSSSLGGGNAYAPPGRLPKRFTATRLTVIALNVAIVGYLVRHVRRERGAARTHR